MSLSRKYFHWLVEFVASYDGPPECREAILRLALELGETFGRKFDSERFLKEVAEWDERSP